MTKEDVKNFAIIGVAGYIAPRHLKAIKETGNNLVAAMDINDSVGILDSYFPDTPFFTRFEDFDRFLDDFKYKGNKVDYIAICTPNYLHGSHIRFARKHGAIAICEKPILTEPWEIEEMESFEKSDGGWKVYTILQVREHPSIKKLKENLDKEKRKDKLEVELTYITARGPWYNQSWKGDENKSGGLAINIGIHFFDMLIWMFGNPVNFKIHYKDKKKITGHLELEKASINWYLSVDKEDLKKVGENDKSAYRSIKFNGEEIEFSNVFSDLHTVVYKKILSGKGSGIEDAKPSVMLLYDIRNANIEEQEPEKDKQHRLYKLI